MFNGIKLSALGRTRADVSKYRVTISPPAVGGQGNLLTNGHVGLPVGGHGVVKGSPVAMGDTTDERRNRHLVGAPLGSKQRVYPRALPDATRSR